MSGIVADRVVIVTGAGQGLGRAHALALARAGARVVVNDVGERAANVAAEITAEGGVALASSGDVADWSYGAELVATAVRTYGRLDSLVNNAGLVRDRMLVNLSEAEWDDVLRVDLKGHFVPLRHAASYWRGRGEAGAPAGAPGGHKGSGARPKGGGGPVKDPPPRAT